MKRTRKWAFVGQEAQRLAGLGMTPREIALKLGVEKSTVTRWIASGKLTKGKRKAPPAGKKPPKGATPPAKWAETVRESYQLDATDEQLVTAGQQALELAYNMAETPQTRLTAMGRFQSIVKQLALGLSDRGVKDVPEPAAKAVPPVVSSRPARASGDPRALFSVVPK